MEFKSIPSSTADTDRLLEINSAGFKIGADNTVNENTKSFVAWSWKANDGAATFNDASSTSVGTIDSVHEANTTAGFSVITYTGTGSAGTLAHGLGATPKFCIFKAWKTEKDLGFHLN